MYFEVPSDIKPSYNATIIETAWCWHKMDVKNPGSRVEFRNRPMYNLTLQSSGKRQTILLIVLGQLEILSDIN